MRTAAPPRALQDRAALPALLISDIDGTLVTPDKRLTPGALAAARRLDAAGVGFTLISSRPPRGMAALIKALGVRLPLAAFNGANLVAPDLTLLASHRLSAEAASRALAMLNELAIDAWVFGKGDWRLTRATGPNVERERRTVGFDPKVVDGFDDVIGSIDKIVGVSDDSALLARVEARLREALGQAAAVGLSQPYYLDVTHPKANKGEAAAALCALIGAEAARTVVIGDMFTDVAMFKVVGLSIAMGQSPAAVKQAADVVTFSNRRDGFAHAVDRFILRAGART